MVEHIDLKRGHPSTSIFPTAQIAEAALQVISSCDYPEDSYGQDTHPFQYGPGLGNLSLRKELAAWVSEKYNINLIDCERICMSCGSSYGLMTILQQFTSPQTGCTRRAFIASPTYFLACSIFHDSGFADLLTAVPTVPGGLDFSGLLAELHKSSAQDIPRNKEQSFPISPQLQHKKIYKYVLYCVPTYSNPTGDTMSLQSRYELVRIAREWDMLIVTDDVYDFLGYEDKGTLSPPLPRLVTIDHESAPRDKAGNVLGAGNTISNCSFSKIVAPGFRCGWTESINGVLAKQMGECGVNRSGGSPSHFTASLIHRLLTPNHNSGIRQIDDIIKGYSRIYSRRAAAYIRELGKALPKTTEIRGGKGGYFLWVGLPEDFDAREILDLAARGWGSSLAGTAIRNKVTFGGGDLFECPGASNRLNIGGRWFRLSLSYSDEEQGCNGIRVLGEAIREWSSHCGKDYSF